MIQQLQLDPVELYQYFRMSAGEFEGNALSTDSEKQDVAMFLCYVIIHLNSF